MMQRLCSFKLILLCLWACYIVWSLFHAAPLRGTKRHVSISLSAHGETSTLQNQPRIAIVGAAGYIGSALQHHLQGRGHDVTGYDRDPRALAANVVSLSSREINDADIQSYDVIVYLGGLTEDRVCKSNRKSAHSENVDDVVHLANRMTKDQVLIFSSTSLVHNRFSGRQYNEKEFTTLDSCALSLVERERVLRTMSRQNRQLPQMIGLRFGEVVGTSPSQRIDITHVDMMCQAYLYGHIDVAHPESNIAVLTMKDMARGIERVIAAHGVAQRFDSFDFCSFNTNMEAVAVEIAAKTGAHLHFSGSEEVAIHGNSMDCSVFEKTFTFKHEGTHANAVADLDNHVPSMCLGRELTRRHGNESTPCVVCGSNDLQTVLDLNEQPLANDFSEDVEVALNREKYPLKLMRCRACQHAQLSHIVDRKRVFSTYNYQSGTNKMIAKYFEFIVDKVVKDTGKQTGTVLEIASNDGAQLDKFKARGWTTHGVDPAANLVELAAAKGHNVQVGFWGQERVENLPHPNRLDAIVAQNVLAHVGSPLDFVRACSAAMGSNTLLYLQTSQCDQMQFGQFDTVYHEHISFFSAHSFQRLAELAGMIIVGFEITPIHGNSCLVTMKKGADNSSTSFLDRLEYEKRIGMNTDWFYGQFRGQAMSLRKWIHQQLTSLHQQDFEIVAYGAAAKGMVLLHFLRDIAGKYTISYVVDDAPMKQGTYCPGTNIPVMPTKTLNESAESRPMAILVLAWNFEAEVLANIRRNMRGSPRRVLAVLPFPKQRILNVFSEDDEPVVTNPVAPVPYPQPWKSSACPVRAVVNSHGDDAFLPYWIRHHAPVFDSVLIVRHDAPKWAHLRDSLPSNWLHVNVANRFSGASALQKATRMYDDLISNCSWNMVLSTNEFLVHPNLRQHMLTHQLADKFNEEQFPVMLMAGDAKSGLSRFRQLIAQRTIVAAKLDGAKKTIRMSKQLVTGRIATESTNTNHEFESNAAAQGFVAKFQSANLPGRGESLPRRGSVAPNGSQRARSGDKANDGPEEGAADFRDIYVNEVGDEQAKKTQRAWYEVTLEELRFRL